MTTSSSPAAYDNADQAPDGAIVVGIDGRDEDRTALDWAAREAASLAAPLHIISAIDVDLPVMASGDVVPMALVEEPLHIDLNARLQAAVARATSAAPEVAVTAHATLERAARALLTAGEHARVIVLGSARAGGLQGIFLGSTSTSVVGLAACPVVVVGSTVPDGGDIVVGYDGSAHARAALGYGAATAARLGCALRVVKVWYLEVVDGIVATTPGSPQFEHVNQRFRERVEVALEPVRAEHPDLDVTIVVRQGRAAEMVREESASARLLVIGTRGRGGITGTLFGSVSRKLLQTASVPVAVLNVPTH